MAHAAVVCPNLELNLSMCPCTNLECDNRGTCCQCVQAHRDSTSFTACMRETPRPESTLLLSKAVPADCPNREVNAAKCTCTYDPCERHGTCCACIRNHWAADGSQRPVCMRA